MTSPHRMFYIEHGLDALCRPAVWLPVWSDSLCADWHGCGSLQSSIDWYSLRRLLVETGQVESGREDGCLLSSDWLIAPDWRRQLSLGKTRTVVFECHSGCNSAIWEQTTESITAAFCSSDRVELLPPFQQLSLLDWTMLHFRLQDGIWLHSSPLVAENTEEMWT